jgi:hypothetical protein
MPVRLALALVSIILGLKAVLIGIAARGRCEIIARCGDGTAWYVGSGIAAAVLVILLVITILAARRNLTRTR